MRASVVAGVNSPPVLEAAQHVLDFVALTVERSPTLRPAAGGTRMWHWLRAFSLTEEGNLDAGSNWAERDAQRGATSFTKS